MAKDTIDPKEIRDQLAQEVLDRIHSDERRADDPQVRDLLRHFRTHLFDRTLEVTEAYKTCGISAKNFPPVFRSIVGENPQNYLIARRLDVACKLLLFTGVVSHNLS